jgi:hypothetical protein
MALPNGPRVLIAGEDAPYLHALRAWLAYADLDAHTSHLASLPHEARLYQADLVILDFGGPAPEHAGLALAALRRQPATATAPVLATAPAAWVLDERRELFQRLGAWIWWDACDLDGLLRCVEMLLGQPRVEGTVP